jgi:hypothetical protein
MRTFLALLLLAGTVAVIAGCEAKVDDSGAKVKVDKP